MSRKKLPPRLYLARGRWVIRYADWMRRTPYTFEQKDEAQALLDKLLGKKNWARAVRQLEPAPRKRGHVPWARSEISGFIYFVSSDDVPEFPIKIGFCAGDINKRLSELQVGSPYTLKVLTTVPATYAQEQAVHAQLSEYRIAGEWFWRSAAVEIVMERALRGLWGDMRFGAETVPSTEIMQYCQIQRPSTPECVYA